MYAYSYLYIYTCTYMYVCIFICVHVCMYKYIDTLLNMYMYNIFIYIYIYIYICIYWCPGSGHLPENHRDYVTYSIFNLLWHGPLQKARLGICPCKECQQKEMGEGVHTSEVDDWLAFMPEKDISRITLLCWNISNCRNSKLVRCLCNYGIGFAIKNKSRLFHPIFTLS